MLVKSSNELNIPSSGKKYAPLMVGIVSKAQTNRLLRTSPRLSVSSVFVYQLLEAGGRGSGVEGRCACVTVDV